MLGGEYVTPSRIEDRSVEPRPGKGIRPPLLSVRRLHKYFPVKEGILGRTRWLRAVDDVSFELHHGEVLGLVGESGSGKSTTGRLILRLLEPTTGEVWVEGENLFAASPARLKILRRDMQIIFQDPYASLNPRMRIRQILEEPSIIHGEGSREERRARVRDLIRRVGLDPEVLDRYPHEFSGGQRQRIGIARAIALSPKLIVADEPVSSLDVSIQAQVINLLQDLRQEFGLSLLFIAHDLNMVRYLCDRVAVMYLGRIVELASKEELFSHPLHPYTQALLDAIPVPNPRLRRRSAGLEGELPSPLEIPSGCRFYGRCPKRIDECLRVDPPLIEVRPGHFAACIRA